MQPTTITTMLLIAFAVGLITMTIRLYFGSWEPPGPRRAPSQPYDPAIEAAVREMRQQIEDYEQRQRRL
jgi:hypothetical protein